MYELLTEYLKLKNIKLENFMFRAVLKSLILRENGESARESNAWAHTFEMIGYVGDGTANNPEMKKAKAKMAKIAGEAWKYYLSKNELEVK
ncbi:hypothetical protein GR724_15320 [Listeria monocytogenes]|nr:hypothetical protein [Listeria monocytogenes]EFN3147716.1 hypothetical protein [Listeria monocytogenes]MCA9766891.1 hypothetical protein [Carnobacterium sp.]HAG7163975.1 hypothetical protein [Listeria monocytogenes]HAK3661082.1 hypothetical protein [Listeria monocytogenes]